MKREEQVHNSVCDYLRLQYPGVFFTSESSGLRVGIGTAKKLKRQRSGNKLPDLIILEPSPDNKYNGLCIEIKKAYEEVFKKNGEYRENEHILAQREVLRLLTLKGYYAVFGCGFDHCQSIIDKYMEGKL